MRDLSKHRYIQELILDSNSITQISGISSLVFLKTLSLANNKLHNTHGLTDELPIETLDLSNNEINDTSNLPNLARLLQVDLSSNHVEFLHDFARCRNLQKLNLSNNRVSDLAQINHLKGLKCLAELNLLRCPITLIQYYRFSVLVRTQQVILLDNMEASVKERIKAQAIHGLDIEARREIFHQYLPNEEFVNYL